MLSQCSGDGILAPEYADGQWRLFICCHLSDSFCTNDMEKLGMVIDKEWCIFSLRNGKSITSFVCSEPSVQFHDFRWGLSSCVTLHGAAILALIFNSFPMQYWKTDLIIWHFYITWWYRCNERKSKEAITKDFDNIWELLFLNVCIWYT